MTDIYEVKSFSGLPGEKQISVPVPGSKSITNRALLIAAMADGTATLRGCMASEDAKHFLECIRTLGFPVSEAPSVADNGQGVSINKDITITGFGGKIPQKKAEIYVGSAGTLQRQQLNHTESCRSWSGHRCNTSPDRPGPTILPFGTWQNSLLHVHKHVHRIHWFLRGSQSPA